MKFTVKIKKVFYIVGLVVVILIALTGFVIREQTTLPSNFTIELHGDYTSSAAQRNYDAELVYVDSLLRAGTSTYYSSGSAGTKSTTCTVTNNQWQDIATNAPCEINMGIPVLTKNELEMYMKDKKIIPIGDECRHNMLCYELTK